MHANSLEKFRAVNDFPELVEYLGDELDWPIDTSDFEEMTFEYSAEELGLDQKTAPKFLEIRRLRPLDKDQPWGIFFIRFDNNTLPVVALRRLLSKLVLRKRGLSSAGDRASWHENDLLLISQTGKEGAKSISFAHFASNPEKTDLPILKVLGWDDDDTGLKLDYVIETLRTKLRWPDDPTDSEAWRNQWRDAFTLKNREVIQNSKEMAERLGQLALAVRTRLREVLAVESDEGPIHKLMSVFKENLISDLDTESFSDMYAQTIAYGLLSARIINPKANTADAAHSQVPITNPFLRELMETFLKLGGRSYRSGIGLDFDELGINEVVDLLDNTNMEAVLRDFGDRNQKEDPVMHFFEGFLQEYDSKIRKDRGVFYTPQPVVAFIVRSVDEQLRTEFGLEDGLADVTTWGELAERTADLEIPEGTSPDEAFVQILDPATGTGTFPVEVIDIIYKKMKYKWAAQGKRASQIQELWNDYVPKHLLPRLHGYELMMAPYAIAHMKIGIKLFETGYRFNSDERARIYLTNALEPAHDFSGTFAFAVPALAQESDAVNSIKKDQRFTVVIGNPPYSYVSSNVGSWITDLVRDYYTVDGQPLGERNPKGLLDDYVKFTRMSQLQIQQSRYGVVGIICNNGFIDNPTFRGMRHSLISTFNTIQILDLHGSAKKKDTDAEGNTDENVFDIQQGVSINIFTKSLIADGLSNKIQHCDYVGTRERKYKSLNLNSSGSVLWEFAQVEAPEFMFFPRDINLQKEYEKFMPIVDAFQSSISGFKTHRDHFAIAFEKATLQDRIDALRSSCLSDNDVITSYNLSDTRDWTLQKARAKLQAEEDTSVYLCPALFRPYDFRYCYLDDAIMDYPRPQFKEHVLGKENLLLCIGRQGLAVNDETWSLVFCSKLPVDQNLYRRGGVTVMPLFEYPISNDLLLDSGQAKSALSKEIQIASRLAFEGPSDDAIVNSFNFFYFVYAVLHSNAYRIRYADFLKSDFPRIPIPKKLQIVTKVTHLGRRLVNMHLMEGEHSMRQTINFIDCGNREVKKVSYSDNTVWINDEKTCGFTGVSRAVWDFYIGGYQVCEKWLKDRKAKVGKNSEPGRVLTDKDIAYYQRLLCSISETIMIIAEIDKVIEQYGGWPDAFINTAPN